MKSRLYHLASDVSFSIAALCALFLIPFVWVGRCSGREKYAIKSKP